MNAARLTDKRLEAITKSIRVLPIVDSVLLFDESSARRWACVRVEQGCGCSALRTVLRFVAKCVADLAREREHVFANNDDFRFVSLCRLLFFQDVFQGGDSTFAYACIQNSC